MEAKKFIAEYHHRMPYILPEDRYDQWLDQSEDSSALDLWSHPAQTLEDTLTWYPVSPRVNNPRLDDAVCVEPFYYEFTECT